MGPGVGLSDGRRRSSEREIGELGSVIFYSFVVGVEALEVGVGGDGGEREAMEEEREDGEEGEKVQEGVASGQEEGGKRREPERRGVSPRHGR